MCVCVSLGACVCPVGNSTQDIETHSTPDIILRSCWGGVGGVLGVANATWVHCSMSVFNIDDKNSNRLQSDQGSECQDSLDGFKRKPRGKTHM